MKHIDSIAMVAALGWLTGCASAPTVAVVEPVGPVPLIEAKTAGQGSLQVYSAREKQPADPNALVRPWNYSVGQLKFTYALAHTDYRLCAADGTKLQYVRNANNIADPTPALVALPAGRYKIEAQAEEAGGETINLMIPVTVAPGHSSVVHLSEDWRPAGHVTNADAVRLPDGGIAGWIAIQ